MPVCASKGLADAAARIMERVADLTRATDRWKNRMHILLGMDGADRRQLGAILRRPRVNVECGKRWRWVGNLVLLSLILPALPAGLSPSRVVAQDIAAPPWIDAAFAGGEMENYLRVLQGLGMIEAYPWGLRGFAPHELRQLWPAADSVHPWSGRFSPALSGKARFEYAALPVRVRVTHNTAFPYGSNDGAVWAGKGFTTELTAGIVAAFGPVSLVLAPTVFRAENATFPLAETGFEGEGAYRDPRAPRFIDLPQRFGDDPLTRLDPGQSTLRVDWRGFASGVSTANQVWGPASDHPLILGNNAPGFPHFFAGTARPVGIGIGTLHGRLIWGRLSESEFSPMADDPRTRHFHGSVLLFSPRGVDGLEIGVARGYHRLLAPGSAGPADFFRPLESLLKIGLPLTGEGVDVSSEDNQIASVFLRWVFPPAGLELYGEYAREDHSWDLRDLLLEPDQQRAYLLGLRRSWRRGEGGIILLRAEVMNSQISSIYQVRPQAPFYRHTRTRQGHTHHGQVLGSASAFTGGGSVLALDYFYDRGRTTLSWQRMLGDAGEPVLPIEADVQHSLGVETRIFRGRMEASIGVNAAYHFNRNFSGDQFNFNTSLGLRMAY